MSKSILARRPGRRSAALLSAAAVAAAGLFAATPAGAVITLGPPRASDGLPAYIVDGEGVAIAPCDTATPVRDCGGAFDPTDPTYWDAGGNAGPIKVSYSVSSPVGGRISRFTGSALTPGRYTIKDPWGTLHCLADAQGKMDCRIGGPAHISTLLRATTAVPGFIGNANVNRTFTGSPTGFNRVQITGPRKFKASTTHLAITGLMRANTAMSAVNTDALTLGRPKNAAPVLKKVHYSSFGTAAARPTVRLAGANANAFKVRNPCRSVRPGRGCNILVAFRPRQHVNQTVKARLLINDNGLAARRTVKLTGVGLAR
jgi:hypothetical protein